MSNGIFYNLDAERSILAAMMKKGIAEKYINQLTPEEFYQEEHQKLFTAMQALYILKKPIDLPLMDEMLTRQNGNADLMNELFSIIQTKTGIAVTGDPGGNQMRLHRSFDFTQNIIVLGKNPANRQIGTEPLIRHHGTRLETVSKNLITELQPGIFPGAFQQHTTFALAGGIKHGSQFTVGAIFDKLHIFRQPHATSKRFF